MHPADEIRLRHLREAATEALRFVGNRGRDDLDEDRQPVWALVKALEIIG